MSASDSVFLFSDLVLCVFLFTVVSLFFFLFSFLFSCLFSSLFFFLCSLLRCVFFFCGVAGHTVQFCRDQHGSRFIQQKLEVSSEEDKEAFFEEILPHTQR